MVLAERGSGGEAHPVCILTALPEKHPHPSKSLRRSAHGWSLPDSVMDNTEFTPLLLPSLENQIIFTTFVFLVAQR